MFHRRYAPFWPAASVSGVSQPTTGAGSGPGSNAGFGVRLLAFIVDGALADLIAFAVNGGFHNNGRQSLSSYVAFLLIELLFVTFAGQTPGMRMFGIGVLRADMQGRASFGWVAVRTLLLAAVIPAVVTDASGRAMHDRAAGTVTIRTR
jgi:uncharacterized RDD family membrane protein YckC